jgi:outer membrane protein
LSLIGVAGAVPFHQSGLTNRYGAIGVNVTLPFLNGGLFKARYEQAGLLARAAAKDTEDLSLQIAAGARVAWLETNTAFRRLDVTRRLLDQTEQALRFANSRYQLGLAGILEVTQAQLAQTSARIGVAGAKYEYLRRLANLRYAQGATQ